MLFPQTNSCRTEWNCPQFWNFRTDPENTGEREGWSNGFESELEIAVPGSWNEQLEEIGLLNYVGSAWYSCTVFIPGDTHKRNYWIRVGSADYRATVWVNGKRAGHHEGAFVPFEFEITDAIRPGARNTLTILVNNELNAETIPQGIRSEDYAREERIREETYPPVRFDYFPFGGIHRPVVIYSTGPTCIKSILVDTYVVAPARGEVRARIAVNGSEVLLARCTISGAGGPISSESPVRNGNAVLTMTVSACRFWSTEDPYRYTLRVELVQGAETVDEYEMQIGVRQVSIVEGKLLLNGKPVYLKGFGRHEDFPVLGKTVAAPLLVKDFGLMKWINANSFRTSHYPYAEETMAMADRQGFLVIDEVPAVSLDLRCTNANTLAAHKQVLKELFDRDYNHPSVIVWALGNEPNLVGDNGYHQGPGKEYWKEVFDCARALDSTRPMTVPNCTRAGISDPVFTFSDILAVNRYYGWYEFPGRIEQGVAVLEQEIEAIHRRYGKPVLMSEFGVDTIPGLHSVADQMFTEEYQEKFLEQYIAMLRSKRYVIGEHVWNFADFRTSQHFRRVVLNMKGIFTRTRQPKAAAFRLKQLWAMKSPTE